ncbi:MAG TPA: transposase [Candidatus Paceibacterota bacterium]
MNRKHIFAPDEFYHVYNRGVDKRTIFTDSLDKERFLKLLYLSNGDKPYVVRDIDKARVYSFDRGQKLVAICVYALMDNHFHLLLRELADGGISKFMQKLTTAYTMYFNTKNQRSGALFQGVFRSKHVDEDEYLRHVASYIHMNPLDMHQPLWKEGGITNKKAAAGFLEGYRYHSLPDYLNKDRVEKIILDLDQFPKYYQDSKEMLEDIDDWIDLVSEIEKSLV